MLVFYASNTSAQFIDIPSFSSISSAAEIFLSTGLVDDIKEFNPEQSITRVEILKILLEQKNQE